MKGIHLGSLCAIVIVSYIGFYMTFDKCLLPTLDTTMCNEVRQKIQTYDVYVHKYSSAALRALRTFSTTTLDHVIREKVFYLGIK